MNSVKKIIIVLAKIKNVIFALFLLLSSLAPYINPGKFWPIAILGLVFPFLLIVNFLFIIFWFFVKRKWSLVSTIIILLALPQLFNTIALRPGNNFNYQKKEGELRILSWNVGLMNYTALDSNEAIRENQKIFDEIKKANADIVCLQEFFTAVIPGNHYNILDSISRTMHYPYKYFSYDFPKFNGNFYSGNVIYSKYPLVDTAKHNFSKVFGSSLIEAKILFGKDTLTIFTTRMQMMLFKQEEYEALYKIKRLKDNDFLGSKDLISKLKYGYQQRNLTLDIIHSQIKKAQGPVIFMGDLNDVPTSFSYRTVKQNMKDAWLHKGFGLGRTYNALSPTLRIDYVFYSKQIKIQQYKQIKSTGSDHYGSISDYVILGE